ncbi:ATP/GTP-binding protein [Kitasatospora sp. MMS16-BH015]|uniref:AAA family ATPase n=1 Tax=Kitasatospora sp. MMS16-BH015 TaxID=2018025 RepID=UPI000CA30F83|nr:AAA family ATPase [Kitasatospora sp. MMS16-BH015]AUG78958.1 ATP/GTP-binding protein [Kitasatospora sp. MMS16-BH015]
MRISISGTYSAGKTSTAIALSYLTGIPRSPAKTIREIMPDAVPGKALTEVTPAEYIQLAVRRHVGRAVNEALLGDSFIADGSSLQEWTYAAARVQYGMDPGAFVDGPPPAKTAEMAFFEDVTAQLGHAFKQHVKESFDGFVHLRNEFKLSADGHRPMNEQFRTACDDMLLEALDELEIPYHVIEGTTAERLEKIVAVFDLPTIRTIDEAIALAAEDYSKIDWRLEKERTQSVAAAAASAAA